MSVVSLLGVNVLNNPAPFLAPYEFEITFECLEQLQKDLEWKITYVGSATSSEYDQELDSLLVGPIPVGVNKFIFEADPPDMKRIPASEILGVTVILLTCSYDGREFVRVGYYVNNEYDDPSLNENPPAVPLVERVQRNILGDKPRVTRFAIKWDSDASAPAEYPPDQPEADSFEDENAYGAEEAELQAALERELAETENDNNDEDGDQAMDGLDDDDEGKSEDLEDTSDEEDDDDDDDEDILEEDDGPDAMEEDDDVEMGDDEPRSQNPGGFNQQRQNQNQGQQGQEGQGQGPAQGDQIMVH
ncbi:Histone chaperone asf1 [Ascosphaera aggregata]|nr:Histone chaperone asf1 [Ascosphaera aggregata]